MLGSALKKRGEPNLKFHITEHMTYSVISTQCTKVSVEDIPFSAVALYGENQHVLIKIYYTNLRQADRTVNKIPDINWLFAQSRSITNTRQHKTFACVTSNAIFTKF